MKKTKKSISDFFTRYHSAQIHSYVLSGCLALVLSLSVVSYSKGVDMRGLMASVAQISHAPEYDADIVLQKSGHTVDVVFGATATEVDRIDFHIMGDPSRIQSLVASDATVTSEGDGMYKVVRDMGHTTVVPGTVITHLSLGGIDSPLAIADTEFVSSGVVYSLTNKGQ